MDGRAMEAEMLKNIEYEKLKGNYILIDVRSPGEFAEATIPGAVCMPIFDDQERSLIGTVYMNDSIEKAKKIGMGVAAARLPVLYEEIVELNDKYDKLVFFCARGGMRSSALASLMAELGIRAYKLKGGYKGYRTFINRALPEISRSKHFIVIHGKTGVGKTELLKCLRQKGYGTLDLEAAANHRGSLLGSVGLGRQNSQKQFESLVYDSLNRCLDRFVFVEGESKRIGSIIIPGYIFDGMEKGTHILAEADSEYRMKRLVGEYGLEGCRPELLAALESLSKYIGAGNAKRCREMIERGECAAVAEELMLKYYDPMYENEFGRYDYALKASVNDTDEGCGLIESWFRTHFKGGVE